MYSLLETVVNKVHVWVNLRILIWETRFHVSGISKSMLKQNWRVEPWGKIIDQNPKMCWGHHLQPESSHQLAVGSCVTEKQVHLIQFLPIHLTAQSEAELSRQS